MLVQANRGLVKDLQNHLETRANLCHWAQALNTIDVWLIHNSQKLSGITTQTLDIATLAFSVNRIEG